MSSIGDSRNSRIAKRHDSGDRSPRVNLSNFRERIMAALVGEGISPDNIETIRPMGGGQYLVINGGLKHYVYI